MKRQIEKEGYQSTRVPPSKGIETDPSLERYPIPPLWLLVAPRNSARSPKESLHQNSIV